MKKVAIISEEVSYPLDEGFKKATVEIANSLTNLGLKTAVFARTFRGLTGEAGRLPANKLLVGRSFARDLKNTGSDLILYIPQSAATSMSILRARMLRMQAAGTPVVVLSLQRRSHAPCVRSLLRLISPSLLLVLSETSARLMRDMGLPVKRIPLGVDTSVFRPPSPGEKERLRQQHGIGDGLIVLHVGHVSPTRNLGLLRRIMGQGRKLVMVTSTSTRRQPEIADALKQKNAIVIDEFLDNIDEIYRLADCYVFPTFSEKGAIEVPLSVLEAMATNLPVVSTAFGGIPDLFRERDGLFLGSTEDEFVRKFGEMLAFREVATRSLVAEYTWDKVARTIVEAVEGVVL